MQHHNLYSVRLPTQPGLKIPDPTGISAQWHRRRQDSDSAGRLLSPELPQRILSRFRLVEQPGALLSPGAGNREPAQRRSPNSAAPGGVQFAARRVERKDRQVVYLKDGMTSLLF